MKFFSMQNLREKSMLFDRNRWYAIFYFLFLLLIKKNKRAAVFKEKQNRETASDRKCIKERKTKKKIIYNSW